MADFRKVNEMVADEMAEKIYEAMTKCHRLSDTRLIAAAIDEYQKAPGSVKTVTIDMRNKVCDLSFDLFEKEFPKSSRETVKKKPVIKTKNVKK